MNRRFSRSGSVNELILQGCKSKREKIEALFDCMEITETCKKELLSLNTQRFPESSETSVLPNGEVEAATLKQLLIYITLPTTNINSQKYFMISFPSFTTAQEVLAAMFVRFYADIDEKKCNIQDDDDLFLVQTWIIRFINEWMQYAPYQFTPNMAQALCYFISFLKTEDNHSFAQVLAPILKELKSNKKKNIIPSVNVPEPILPSTPEESWTVLSINPIELARQLTLYHSSLFNSVESQEILKVIWKKIPQSEGGSNLNELVKHFDLIASFVSFTIIMDTVLKNRAETHSYWIDVANELYKERNYHGLFAVVCGITHPSVKRLKNTVTMSLKSSLDKKKKYNKLVEICDISNDYAKYREKLEKNGPCIPLIGIFQKDLVYVQESVPNRYNDLINFKKCAECAKLIQIIEMFQNHNYNFILVPRIQALITSIPGPFDLTILMNMSNSKEKMVRNQSQG